MLMTQIFISYLKYDLFSTISNIFFCIGKISFWNDSMFLKLNHSKFDLIYFSKSFFDFLNLSPQLICHQTFQTLFFHCP